MINIVTSSIFVAGSLASCTCQMSIMQERFPLSWPLQALRQGLRTVILKIPLFLALEPSVALPAQIRTFVREFFPLAKTKQHYLFHWPLPKRKTTIEEPNVPRNSLFSIASLIEEETDGSSSFECGKSCSPSNTPITRSESAFDLS